MDLKEFQSMGGNATKQKYAGTDHFEKIGAKGGNTIKRKYGPNYFKDIKRGIKPSEIKQK